VSSRRGQAEFWHVDIHAFAFAGLDEVGLVPDADGSVVANGAVEGGPGWEMMARAIVGVGDELIEALPILLDDNDPAGEGAAVEQQPGLRLFTELREHARHGKHDGKPFSDCKKIVNAHADEKKDDRLLDVRGIAAGNDFIHVEHLKK
jgi:hypothetical protein